MRRTTVQHKAIMVSLMHTCFLIMATGLVCAKPLTTAPLDTLFFESQAVDFIQIPSTITRNVKFAIVVFKPEKPSPVLLLAHGWHGHAKRPKPTTANPYPGYLTVQVDMRGRKFSTGKPDANGYELYDYYDAYQYVIENYKQYISNPDLVYFLGGSGGGGNGYGLLGKFPDLFASAVIYCGISDYALWFRQDFLGEFRDEMRPWIGSAPSSNLEAYNSRSGITTVKNLQTPVFIVHGETDERVPVSHARNYYQQAKTYNKTIEYLELRNVGTRAHWGNITREQMDKKLAFTERALTHYKRMPELPTQGELTVAGYVVTRHFSVFLDSIDMIGRVTYDLNSRQIHFEQGSGQVTWR